MTLRAGGYAQYYRGVIRDDSSPVYRCTHEHATFHEARDCARNALPAIRDDVRYPEGWVKFEFESP